MICFICTNEFKCCEGEENIKPKYKSCMMRHVGFPQSVVSFKDISIMHICSEQCFDKYQMTEHSMDYQDKQNGMIKLCGANGWSITYDPKQQTKKQAQRELDELISENSFW